MPPREAFLKDASEAVAQSGWRLLGNQIPMGRVHVPSLSDARFDAVAKNPEHPAHGQWQGMAALGKADLPIYLDTWDGYPWARERLYAVLAETASPTPSCLRRQPRLLAKCPAQRSWGSSRSRARHHGYTSPGDFAEFGKELGAEIDARLAAHNPEVLWTDNGLGAVRLTLPVEAGPLPGPIDGTGPATCSKYGKRS